MLIDIFLIIAITLSCGGKIPVRINDTQLRHLVEAISGGAWIEAQPPSSPTKPDLTVE